MIKAEELAKKMRKQRCHHCKDGRSFDGQFIFCGNKGLFSLHFCPGCGAPLTENGEEILVGRLNGALYCWDIWGENGGPKEISYLEAATLLAETADKMEERPPEGEKNNG